MRLTEVTDELRERVLELAPRRDQQPYSGRARDTIGLVRDTTVRRAVTGLDDDGVPVGFLILDTGPSMIAVHRPGTVGVRGFYVDAAAQGRGHGTAMLLALPDYVREHYPQAQRIALTVNTQNAPARRAYLRAGFVDTGRIYRGGALGPQHVLERAL
jgi:RimJ/RimL family protein N-acetyltransferase